MVRKNRLSVGDPINFFVRMSKRHNYAAEATAGDHHGRIISFLPELECVEVMDNKRHVWTVTL